MASPEGQSLEEVCRKARLGAYVMKVNLFIAMISLAVVVVVAAVVVVAENDHYKCEILNP